MLLPVTFIPLATIVTDRELKELIGTINHKPHTHIQSITDLIMTTTHQVVELLDGNVLLFPYVHDLSCSFAAE